MLVDQPPPTDNQLIRAVGHMNGNITGLAAGALAGLLVFVATLWLVLKGGDRVGPHLQLLSHYFIGYTVTVAGSFVGLCYGFATGYIAGWLVAEIYNRLVAWKRR